MDAEFKHLLEKETALIRGSATWGDSRLDIAFNMSDLLPPIRYVTSVRAVVFRGDSVLVIRDGADSYHVMPGGRREGNESLDQTLRREILEETRWTIGNPIYLGFSHLRLDPKQPDEKYPHPDFCQIFYMAEEKEYFPENEILDDWVLEADLMPIEKVWALNIDDSQELLLKTALRLRAESSGEADNQ